MSGESRKWYASNNRKLTYSTYDMETDAEVVVTVPPEIVDMIWDSAVASLSGKPSSTEKAKNDAINLFRKRADNRTV